MVYVPDLLKHPSLTLSWHQKLKSLTDLKKQIVGKKQCCSCIMKNCRCSKHHIFIYMQLQYSTLHTWTWTVHPILQHPLVQFQKSLRMEMHDRHMHILHRQVTMLLQLLQNSHLWMCNIFNAHITTSLAGGTRVSWHFSCWNQFEPKTKPMYTINSWHAL